MHSGRGAQDSAPPARLGVRSGSPGDAVSIPRGAEPSQELPRPTPRRAQQSPPLAATEPGPSLPTRPDGDGSVSPSQAPCPPALGTWLPAWGMLLV